MKRQKPKRRNDWNETKNSVIETDFMRKTNTKYFWEYPCKIQRDKTVPFRTYMHYSDPDADKELTVFGAPKKGLFYNYSDRLYGDAWDRAWATAKKFAEPQTARFFEIALNEFHDTDDVDLQHVVLGVNRSNGYHYLIFGYTYTEKNLTNKPK